MAPSRKETALDRKAREEDEREARRISEAIDDQLRAERSAQKRKRIVKLLLLGQSESGKSTTLRQFQLKYTPAAFKEERASWRSVIQLNVIRSVKVIIEAMLDAQAENLMRPPTNEDNPSDDRLYWTPVHDTLVARLRPLLNMEAVLMHKLGSAAVEDDDRIVIEAPPRRPGQRKDREVAVRADWRAAFGKFKKQRNSLSSDASDGFIDEPTDVLYAARLDVMALWHDPTVRDLLSRKKIRLEEGSGFFLNDVETVASLRYQPSNDDVLRARIKTQGVTEYRFDLESSAGSTYRGAEWRIVDVGGSRAQRASWAPFFDDMDAIIFLAPVCAFDQVLAEDRSVNRLEDTVLLWKMVCSNKLLAKIQIILFLNKIDILEAKLHAGVRLAKYVRSFGERPNDLETALRYFKSKFHAIQREYSPNPRIFYGFCTAVTDTTTTSAILASVHDVVIRENLARARLL